MQFIWKNIEIKLFSKVQCGDVYQGGQVYRPFFLSFIISFAILLSLCLLTALEDGYFSLVRAEARTG